MLWRSLGVELTECRFCRKEDRLPGSEGHGVPWWDSQFCAGARCVTSVNGLIVQKVLLKEPAGDRASCFEVLSKLHGLAKLNSESC